MLEIIILINTGKAITRLCKERGMKSLVYNLLNVFGYFFSVYGFVIVGVILSEIFNNGFLIFLGFVLGIGGYAYINYLIRKKIKETPVFNDNEINQIGMPINE